MSSFPKPLTTWGLHLVGLSPSIPFTASTSLSSCCTNDSLILSILRSNPQEETSNLCVNAFTRRWTRIGRWRIQPTNSRYWVFSSPGQVPDSCTDLTRCEWAHGHRRLLFVGMLVWSTRDHRARRISRGWFPQRCSFSSRPPSPSRPRPSPIVTNSSQGTMNHPTRHDQLPPKPLRSLGTAEVPVDATLRGTTEIHATPR